jgi:hypothetical protein
MRLRIPRIQRSRRAERGAALIEALIVISTLMVCFLVLIFFRELYMRHLMAARTARAGVLAYAQVGCEGDSPADWLGSDDLGRLSAGQANPSTSEAIPEGAMQRAADADDRATKVMGEIKGTTTEGGEGFLNKTIDTEVTGDVWVGNEGDLFSEPTTVFESPVRWSSTVSCADPVRGGFDGAADYMKDAFTDLVTGIFG